uniref:Uncharacterized protein n=1 Tax=Arundo donax TaxID=35708 RepID=A0A0A9FQN2_ARUDO
MQFPLPSTYSMSPWKLLLDLVLGQYCFR